MEIEAETKKSVAHENKKSTRTSMLHKELRKIFHALYLAITFKFLILFSYFPFLLILNIFMCLLDNI
jgi:hypothetical protein